MRPLNNIECINRIKSINKNWKRSCIEVIHYQQWPSLWYRIIKFKYKGVLYEYREDASNSWIDVA